MSLVDDLAEGRSGLEQLRALMRSGEAPAIGRTLDFSLVEIEEGRAVFEGAPSAAVYNPIGTVHGGYAAALLDSACGCAVSATIAPRYPASRIRRIASSPSIPGM